jgi:hypothetical protein
MPSTADAVIALEAGTLGWREPPDDQLAGVIQHLS